MTSQIRSYFKNRLNFIFNKISLINNSIFLLGLILFLSLMGGKPTSAQAEAAFIRYVRAIETADVGIANPAGLAFSPGANAFRIMQAHAPGRTPPPFTDLVKVTPFEDLAGSARI
ncbi:MAG: hypothetical protein KAS36_13735, partial [Anaerolineales bacterium]|nr:hypothetical protein [Anaerolineales bacterium]